MSAAPAIPAPPRRNGFQKIQHDSLLDWPRLLSGTVQFFAVMYINSEIHCPRDKGTPAPKWTRPITHAELAVVCRCTVRAVEIKLKDLMDRKVVEGKRTATGFRYHIPFETWASLPDFVAVVELVPEAAPVDEDQTDDPQAKREFRMEKPQTLKAGQKSRPLELGGCAPGKASVRTNLPITYTIEVVNGTAIFNVLEGEQQEKREEQAKANRKIVRVASSQPPKESTKEDYNPLHQLLDDYCLSHHGTIPNDKLLAKIQSALGKATIAQFKTIIQARIRSGKVIPMPWFINLAEDAALAAKDKPSGDDERLARLEAHNRRVKEKFGL